MAEKKAAPRKAAPKSKAQLNAERRLAEAAVRVREEVGKIADGRNVDDLEVTDASEWKKATRETKLLLPSGNVCLVTNPGITSFVMQGLIPNSLMPTVMQAIEKGQGVSSSKLRETIEKPEMLNDMMAMMDNVVVCCVIRPTILPMPTFDAKDFQEGKCSEEQLGQTAPSKKERQKLYVDEVDLLDRQFIFQWVVGGTRDLDKFREQSSALVAELQAGEGMGEAAQ